MRVFLKYNLLSKFPIMVKYYAFRVGEFTKKSYFYKTFHIVKKIIKIKLKGPKNII